MPKEEDDIYKLQDEPEPPKRISNLHKWYLKYTNPNAYHAYKQSWRNYHSLIEHRRALKKEDENYKTLAEKIIQPFLNHPFKHDTIFKHSGNSGDIIYSLPVVYALAKNGNAHLLLHSNQGWGVVDHFHPLGDVMLNDTMIEMLKPLLLLQPKIKSCKHFNDELVDYDLDLFRQHPVLTERIPIVRWHSHIFAVFPDYSQPWLNAPHDNSYSDYIVVARSHRYRAPNINYSFLKRYPKKLFIGIPEEYEDMKLHVHDIEFVPVKDFLEMATIINSCRFFIGNQSLPFSLAEALKVNRVLEVFYKWPNVVVQGPGGHDFLYQKQFEKTVEMLWGEGA